MICRNSFASLVFVVRNRLLIFISSSSLWKRAFPYLTVQKKTQQQEKGKKYKNRQTYNTSTQNSANDLFIIQHTFSMSFFPLLFVFFSSHLLFALKHNFLSLKIFLLISLSFAALHSDSCIQWASSRTYIFFASSFSACIIFSWTRASGSFPIPLGCCFAVVRLERESCGSVKMKMKPQPKRKHQQNARQKKQQQRVRDKHFHTAPKEKKTFLFKQFVFLISKSRDAGVRFRKPYWQRSEKMQREKWNKKEDARGSTKKRINM